MSPAFTTKLSVVVVEGLMSLWQEESHPPSRFNPKWAFPFDFDMPLPM